MLHLHSSSFFHPYLLFFATCFCESFLFFTPLYSFLVLLFCLCLLLLRRLVPHHAYVCLATIQHSTNTNPTPSPFFHFHHCSFSLTFSRPSPLSRPFLITSHPHIFLSQCTNHLLSFFSFLLYSLRSTVFNLLNTPTPFQPFPYFLCLFL